MVLLGVPVRQPDPSDPMDLEAAAQAARSSPAIQTRREPLVSTPAEEPAPA